MNRIAKTLTATTLCLFAALPAYAGHGHRNGHGDLMERMERQQDRIEQGIDAAQLSRKEVKALKREQWEIRRLARELREDGRLSKRDRRILDKELDRASHHIWELKHNEVRGYAYRERIRPLHTRDARPHNWHDSNRSWRRYGYNDF